MRLYDPTTSRQQRHLSRAKALPALQGKSIGILENGKLNAEAMLREIAQIFVTQDGCRLHAVYSKVNPSAPAPAATLAKAATEVDFLITGLGD